VSTDIESSTPSAATSSGAAAAAQPGRLTVALQRLRHRRRRSTADEDLPPETPEPRLPGRRNPRWIALGVVAICVGGLLSYLIYARVATENTVLALGHTIYRGQTVAASDLVPVTLSGDPGVATVPVTERDALVGQRAVYDLVDGSILAPGAIAPVKVPADERTLVGILVAAGRAPSNHLFPGSSVRLIAVPPPNAEAGFRDAYTGKTFAARVVDQQPGPDGASVLVNVDVSDDQAPVVALLAAQDRLSLVRDADR
jgi:hypothetical protein